MPRQRTQLIALQIIGGGAVLASYLWGFFSEAVQMTALWGGVPETLRPLYAVNMWLAAGGYFLFAPFVTFRLHPATVQITAPGKLRFGYGAFLLCFALVLIPSALWLPLTAHYLEAPALMLWFAIRLVLALAGAATLALAAALWRLENPPPGRAWALAGLLPFALQTALLDALLWPAFFAR